jgi:hypothetical protein
MAPPQPPVISSQRDLVPDMNSNARIDALELMLTDLRTRNESIRHKAAFRGCQPEFQALVSQLIEQLETELLEQKRRQRNANRA